MHCYYSYLLFMSEYKQKSQPKMPNHSKDPAVPRSKAFPMQVMQPSPFEAIMREEMPVHHHSQYRKPNGKEIGHDASRCLPQERNYPQTVIYAHSSRVKVVVQEVQEQSNQLKRGSLSPFEEFCREGSHQREEKKPRQDIARDQASAFQAFFNEEAQFQPKPRKHRRQGTQASSISSNHHTVLKYRRGPSPSLSAMPQKNNSSELISKAVNVDLNPAHPSQLHSCRTSRFSKALFLLTKTKYEETKKKMDAQPYQGSDYELLLPKSPLFENDLNRGLIRHTVKDQPNEKREVRFRRRQKRKVPLYQRFILKRTLNRIEDELATPQSSSIECWLDEWLPHIKEAL